jgi:hypothetical protein
LWFRVFAGTLHERDRLKRDSLHDNFAEIGSPVVFPDLTNDGSETLNPLDRSGDP